MPVYDKPPKRSVGPSRGKRRKDLIAEYNKRYGEPPQQGGVPPPAPKKGDDKA